MYISINHPKWTHDDVIKLKHFRVTGPLCGVCAGNSPVTGEFPSQRPVTQSFMFSLICAWTSSWVNNWDTGALRRHRAHYDVIVMWVPNPFIFRVGRVGHPFELVCCPCVLIMSVYNAVGPRIRDTKIEYFFSSFTIASGKTTPM